MAKTLKDKIIDLLISNKIIKKDDLDKAVKLQKDTGQKLIDIIVEQGLASKNDVMSLLSQELGIPPINLSKYKIDPIVIEKIPERFAKQYNLIPISKIGNILTVAMSDPLNVFAIDDLKAITKLKIEVVLSNENDIKDAVASYYAEKESQITKILEEAKKDQENVEVVQESGEDFEQYAKEGKAAPVVKIVDLIIAEALKKRASDIHIEPTEKNVRVRYRVDGNLQESLTIPKKNQNAVLARLKIMSKLDITENRLPQDGRFKIKLEDKEVDFRVSILPLAFGGKVVLRILDKSNLSIGLERLGFLPGPLNVFKEALKRPYGMILVTGPTGSGKSTTLYSIITQLNKTDRNIITIEDPVEYQIEGITQIAANPDIGLTFASGLRSLLRQSPDVIMVGEIRDAETADIAIKASLTGELVLSTLHTNDAPGAITRLIDMGVEPFLIASSLVMTCAQRLIRKICPSCKEPYNVPKSVFERMGFSKEEMLRVKDKQFYHGKGCAKCRNSGYYGRIGLLEALLINDEIRNMIIKRVPSDQIKSYAVTHGMETLRDCGINNFILGNTTLEEVLRVTSEE